MYIFIRADIDPTYQIIQTGHALFEHAIKLDKKPEQISSFCLLQAKDEKDLLKISSELEMKDINFTIFNEPDYDTGYTAIAAGPIYGKDRKMFKKFKYFK